MGDILGLGSHRRDGVRFKGKKEGKREKEEGMGRTRGWQTTTTGRVESRQPRGLVLAGPGPGTPHSRASLRLIFPRISYSASIKFKVSHLS